MDLRAEPCIDACWPRTEESIKGADGYGHASRALANRTETFAARRQGGAVQSISAEADNTALLRFYGWMAATNLRYFHSQSCPSEEVIQVIV